jgi:carbamoyltransferase
MPQFVLGINFYGHDSSAALLRDGELIFAGEEERFSRMKKDWRFPKLTIEEGLQYAGIQFGDLDAIAFGWNRPGLMPLHTLRCALTGKVAPHWAADALLNLGREVYGGNGLRALRSAFGDVHPDKIHYIDHHEAHAWSAYALSGFDDALVVIMDGRGACAATTIYDGRGHSLKKLKEIAWPNSIGTFYHAFTDLLGFERNNDEWKVMGLAAYGEPVTPLHGTMRTTTYDYQVDGWTLSGKSFFDLSYMVPKFGPRRAPEKHISDEDRNLAASAQQAAEEAIFAVVREGVRLTGKRTLCLAGGVAMNCKANGRLLASGLVDQIFVQPAATDDGTAIGAALGVYPARGLPVPWSTMNHAALGPEFDDGQIESTLRAYKLPINRVQDIAPLAARLLSRGHIVGWFQGRMEFGPRALGNRSILADPRDPAMKDRVNEVVKFREGWRPFAPACLAERASEYFVNAYPSPFMILTFDVKPDKRSVIPAVTHADNTARLQTVQRDVNPEFWHLISEFDRITGVPVVMNTSFNLRGEPIVCTPKDALRTFYSSGMDFLVLGHYVLAKEHLQHELTEHLSRAGEAAGVNGSAAMAVTA